MSSKPSHKFNQQELVAGRYMTSHVIGKGGMGKVVYGKHVDLQQEVAIKYLRTSSRSGSESASKRFCQDSDYWSSVIRHISNSMFLLIIGFIINSVFSQNVSSDVPFNFILIVILKSFVIFNG